MFPVLYVADVKQHTQHDKPRQSQAYAKLRPRSHSGSLAGGKTAKQLISTENIALTPTPSMAIRH
jgi:hypothetical protein